MKQTMISIVILFLLAGQAWPVSAAPPTGEINTAAIDQAVQSQMAKHGLPGVALAVTKGDQILYLKGYGQAAAGRPMTPQTPMYLGSQSKAFTGLAVAQLASEGRLELNVPVQRYIPWFAVTDPQASKLITINHLLHHTSGMTESGWLTVLPDDAPLEEAVRSLSTARLNANPGQKFQYFNLNYSVLMLVVETISGERFSDYLQKHIFDPLKMAHTYTDPADAAENGLAQGYGRLFGFPIPKNQPHRTYQLGTGFIMSTAEDMAHWTIALNNQGAYEGGSILPAGRMAMLFAPVQGYGMGWFIASDHYSHGGANEAFRTEVNLYPSQQLGLVLLVNEGSMMDHETMSPQLLGAVEAAVLGFPQPAWVASGWSVRVMGLCLLAAVLALAALHGWNFWNLRTWQARASRMRPARLAFDVAISFIIPSIILGGLGYLVMQDLGYRFNLTYQIIYMFQNMPEQALLMVMLLPDYVQGIIKLVWVLPGKTRSLDQRVLRPARGD